MIAAVVEKDCACAGNRPADEVQNADVEIVGVDDDQAIVGQITGDIE